jgi:hypothetical protein
MDLVYRLQKRRLHNREPAQTHMSRTLTYIHTLSGNALPCPPTHRVCAVLGIQPQLIVSEEDVAEFLRGFAEANGVPNLAGALLENAQVPVQRNPMVPPDAQVGRQAQPGARSRQPSASAAHQPADVWY